MDVERVITQIEVDFESAHIERLLKYIRQPSVSALNLGNDEMARMLADEIIEVGGEAEVVETAEFPVVYGLIDEGAERTLLCHGLYDVTPAEEPGWINPPFEPEIQELEGLGPCIVGRGAEDMKTGIACVMNAVYAARAAGEKLPLNLMFVTRGDPNSAAAASRISSRATGRRCKRRTRPTGSARWGRPTGTPIVPAGAQGQPDGQALLPSGGVGAARSGQRDSCAQTANWIGNPAERIVEAIAYLQARLEEIYQNGEGWTPSEAEEELCRKLAERMDPERMKQSLGVERFRQDDFRAAVRSHLFKAEFTLTGLHAGLRR